MTGALARAFLVMVLITFPALMLPEVGPDTRQVVVLFGLIAAVLTFIEYSATYPSLVEFRYAPPFNRIRFLSLALTVIALALIVRGQFAPTTFALLLEALGALVGQALDFPYSPVRMVTLMLPEDAAPARVGLIRSLAGMSFMVSAFMLLVFFVALRLSQWPAGRDSFNVWVNLPTFDPTAGGDVVDRLERDARFNLALGLLLPFLIPAAVKLASALSMAVPLGGAQTLVWVMAAWGFLPASLFMRGVAMWRVARMIREKRERSLQEHGSRLQTV